MKKRYNTRNKYVVFGLIAIFLIIIILSIGYSSLSSEMAVYSSAVVRIEKDIRITQFTPSSYAGGGVSNWEEHNVSSTYAGISLPNSNSTVTYSLQVTNLGNMEASVSAITGLPSNLKYTISGYTLGDMMCDDQDPTLCKLGSTTTILITIGYATNGYDSSNTDYNIAMDYTFSYMIDSIARIGNQYYNTLQAAINAVPSNGTETVVELLNNTSEAISISAGKNVSLNLNSRTLSNDGNKNVIVNKGTLNLYGGTVYSNAATNGAINNESKATFNMSSGSVIMTGDRQALYNNKGTATISGTAYLSSSATARAPVHNVSGGTMYITGGTIVSTGTYGIQNLGTLTVGVKNGSVNNQSPSIRGITNGLNSTVNFNFYDGIVKAKDPGTPFNQVSRITDKETGYGIVTTTEVIDGQTYNISYLGITNTVRFMGNGGNVSGESIKYIESGHEVGTLPTAVRSGYDFLGWFTAASGGREIRSDTIITADIDFYAHWAQITEVASIGDRIYNTLQSAINAAPANTPTSITLLKDINEIIDIAATKNVSIDLNGHTMRNVNTRSLVVNEGTVTFSNGSIISSATESAINNNDGNMVINNVSITSTGQKQALYILAGNVEITGNSYLSSQTDGIYTGQTLERGTVHNVGGTLTITGGTIVGIKQNAVSNSGVLIIGAKDGNIDTTSPVLTGALYGLHSDGTAYYYDGVLKGKSEAYVGTFSELEDNSSIVSGVEAIDEQIYKTAHLEIP